MAKSKKVINLALQGGGAHGAFTWGILDRFLESELFTIEGISATSAGSMNAVVLAQGLIEGGNVGARTLLHDFWKAMSEYGNYFLTSLVTAPWNFFFFNTLAEMFSPYQFNPLNFHPIREVLEKIIDVDEIKHKSGIRLFICATNVHTGKIHIFNEKELSIEVILASACLPKLFQAVEINGEHYWDGGYLGNPAIFPLIYETKTPDIIILHTVPIERKGVPTNVLEIETRLREISFNSSLMREMRAIAFVSKMIDQGWIKEEFKDKLKKLYMHCIRADKAIQQFPLSSVFTPDWGFLTNLRDLGRKEADHWIAKHYDAINHETTIDFQEWL